MFGEFIHEVDGRSSKVAGDFVVTFHSSAS
jgi:hypothetical protein